MPTSKDYYGVLGVAKGASTTDIKKAYRKLAHKYHPDKGGTKEDEAKFKEVQHAYEVLSDDTKRQTYDQFGEAGVGGQGQAGGPGGPGGAGFSGFEGFDFGAQGFGGFGDIFEQFFSGAAGTQTRGPARGADLQVRMTLEFDEAVKGVTKQIRTSRRVQCATCSGSGAEPGSKIVTCSRCNGQGQIQTARQTILGTMAQVTTCPECHGQGKKPEKACHTCGGEGRVQQSGQIEVQIPAGIDDGQTIRVPGQGEAGERGAPSGHLYVTVQVKPSKLFERDGVDVRVTVPIPYSIAVLGGTIEVPTLSGTTALKIPAGTASHETFTTKGEGIQKLGGAGRGNLLVTVEVDVPKKLSAEERDLIKQLDELAAKHADKKGWRGKLGL